MGFFDKVKGAMQAVTGGGARVVIEFPQQVFMAGDALPVRVTVTSTGGEMKSKGIFIDIEGQERVHLKKGDAMGVDNPISASKTSYQHSYQISPEFALAANETKLFEGSITLPATAQPSFKGTFSEHAWVIRGRMEAFGNDPDSGWQPLWVGTRA